VFVVSQIPGLSGAVALVAGVGPGLGTATALALGRAGAQVVVAARNPESTGPAAAALEAENLSVAAVTADLRVLQARAGLLSDVGRRFGRLDVLVCNASASGGSAAFADADLSEWRETMEVNLWSGLSLAQESLGLLRAGGRARIVFVSAMTTRLVSAAGRGGYAISKAALNQAVKTLAYELGPEGMRVNAVVPGWMETPIVAQWRADPALSRHVEHAETQIPLGRIPATAEVAGSVVFLASDLSGAVTGELIDANGGQFMRG
jgi:NAD(P)-dependent dehydrogenase (short-subunit alcohol dehydrogenase family)